MNKKKGKEKGGVLCITQLPPPVHGASMMNAMSVEVLKELTEVKLVGYQLSNDISNIEQTSLLKLFKYTFVLLKILLKLIFNRPSLVYFTPSPTGLAFIKDSLIILLVKLLDIKIVCHIHGKGVSDYSGRPLYRFLYRMCFGGRTCLILLAPSLYEEYEIFANRTNVYFLPNAIEAISSQHLIEGKKDNSPVLKILFLSNLREGKGIFLMMDALKILLKKGEQLDVKMAGPWMLQDEEMRMEAIIKEMEQEFPSSFKIEFAGMISGDEKYLYYNWCDVFCFPSLIDTFPLVVLEAMASSCAIVASDVGAVPDIISDGETGLLFSSGSEQELANKLGLMKDKDIRNRLELAAREDFNQKYLPATYKINLKNIISAIIAQRS